MNGRNTPGVAGPDNEPTRPDNEPTRPDNEPTDVPLDELERRALDAVDAGVVISEATEDTPIVYVNEGFTRMTGYDPDEVIGSNCRFLQGEETDERPVASMRKGIAEERETSVVLRNYRKDGTVFWNEVEITPVRDDDDEVTHFFGFQRDVTERKRAQIELGAARRSLRELYAVTTDRSISFEERVERTLAVGCQRLGVDLGFLTRITDDTQTVVHAVGDHPELQAGAACPLSESYCRRTLDTDGLLAVVHAASDEEWTDDLGYERFELECYLGGKVTVDGELYGTLCFADVEPRSEPFTESQATFVELLTRWVSYELERRKQERELRIADRRFRSLFDNPMTFAAVLDPDGTLREVNDTALVTLSDGTDLVGRPFWETPWWTPSDDSVAAVEAAVETAAGGQLARFECDYFHRDGTGTVAATLYPVYDVDPEEHESEDATGDEVVSLMAVGADTTTRTEQATQLKRQRDRLEEFASMVSHDLRSPLEVARGRLQLYDNTDDPDHLDEIEASLDRMSTLIDDLLTLARQGKSVSDLEPTPVAAVATRAWNTVETADASLAVVLDDETAVAADPSRLQQLFENLFRNAVEHGSAGPRPEARGDSVERSSTSSRLDADDSAEHDGSPVTVRLAGLDDAAGFAVEDDGPGIPPADRDHVFERGFSTDRDGTGFGLAIVRHVAEAHGWTVRATESDAGGARFEVRVDA
ncbi:PAS domain-containing protein [Salinigranum salinum]|uniref:PAS domain-containing protein n=1 Tax=Salinigranum salinum TaxID=1364937 RepID=UPI0012610638|nr:PAS domain-containing protein [Salinigranum salinum]